MTNNRQSTSPRGTLTQGQKYYRRQCDLAAQSLAPFHVYDGRLFLPEISGKFPRKLGYVQMELVSRNLTVVDGNS